MGNRTIRVERAVDPSGDVKPTKTDHMTTVRLLDPVAADLAALRAASGASADNAVIFARAHGKA